MNSDQIIEIIRKHKEECEQASVRYNELETSKMRYIPLATVQRKLYALDAQITLLQRILDESGYVEAEDAICEQCTRETALCCPRCKTYTCVHYSLEPTPGEHRCNWCEGKLEGGM